METCLFRRLVQWNLMNFEYYSITENFRQVFTLVNVVKIIFCQVAKWPHTYHVTPLNRYLSWKEIVTKLEIYVNKSKIMVFKLLMKLTMIYSYVTGKHCMNTQHGINLISGWQNVGLYSIISLRLCHHNWLVSAYSYSVIFYMWLGLR